MTFSNRHLVLLGLLELDDSGLATPKQAPEAIERTGHWHVEHHADLSVWRCLCRRSEPLLVPADFRKRVRLPNDLVQACEVCRAELAAASSRAGKLKAWLERNRHTIDPVSDLDYIEGCEFISLGEEDGKQRIRRFVYQAFFKKELKPDAYVSSKCSNPYCINPYHLCLKSARNQKVTPQIQKAIHHLQELGISAKITQRVIAEKFETRLSISTIQGIRAGSKQLLTTAA